MLEKKLEEVRKRVLWEDPAMVTVCVGTWVCWQGVRARPGSLRANAAGHCVTPGTGPARGCLQSQKL